MPFARKIIGADERLIMVCRLHWIYLVQGICWFLALSGGGFYIDNKIWLVFGNGTLSYNYDFFGYALTYWMSPFKWLFVLAGTVMLVTYVLKVASSEIALTNRRVIYKTGLIFVELEEIELEEIKGERVHHGLLGWFLGYGTVFFDCRFIGDVLLPAIRNPYKFLRAAHAVRSKMADTYAYAFPVPPPAQKPPQNLLGRDWQGQESIAPDTDQTRPDPPPSLRAPRRRRFRKR